MEHALQRTMLRVPFVKSFEQLFVSHTGQARETKREGIGRN
jgi:hypothetical protein